MNPMPETKKSGVKVDRKCSYCKRRCYSWYSFKTGRVSCANCSFEWVARLKRDEDPRETERGVTG